MTTVIQSRSELDFSSIWERFSRWMTSTENRIYLGWFSVLMIPTLLVAATSRCYSFGDR
jgi:photosystem II P680 reaction center D1 protein